MVWVQRDSKKGVRRAQTCRISSPHAGLRREQGERQSWGREGNLPRCLVDQVANSLLLVPNDMYDRMAVVAKLLKQLAVLLTLNDTSSASDNYALRMLREELAKDDGLCIAKSSPSFICRRSKVQEAKRLERAETTHY